MWTEREAGRERDEDRKRGRERERCGQKERQGEREMCPMVLSVTERGEVEKGQV